MLEQLFLILMRWCGFRHLLWSPSFSTLRKRFSTEHLELGLSKKLQIRREMASKGAVKNNLKIIYASDIHLHPVWQNEIVLQLREAVSDAAPDAILLGGDLADDRASLSCLRALVSDLTAYAPVFAVPGNHDVVLGEHLVRSAVLEGGGVWLPDGAQELSGATQTVRLLGTLEQTQADGALQILCGHDPALFPEAEAKAIDLVFAGHIHGGQVVLWSWKGRMYPGAFAYAWNRLGFVSERTQLFVSRGIVDFFPLRWRCPREVILLEV
ncbi:MAG: metallophosphoesterase [Bdellovibrionota bacterium]